MRRPMSERYRDGHHILHERREWTNRPQASAIREHPSLIPRIPRELHEEIHANVPPVPLLGYYALVRTAKLWTPDPDTITSMENLMEAIDKASKHERSHPIESDLAHLAIQAIDLQRPFLRGNY